MNGNLIAWKSKQQDCVTLFVAEAEYIAAVHCAAEMLFILQVVESLGIEVQLPMTLHVDSEGAKRMANNWSTKGRTKHIDVRHHFLRELTEKGIIECKHVKGVENLSDLLTKNVQESDFQKHQTKMVMKISE